MWKAIIITDIETKSNSNNIRINYSPQMIFNLIKLYKNETIGPVCRLKFPDNVTVNDGILDIMISTIIPALEFASTGNIILEHNNVIDSDRINFEFDRKKK